VLSLVLLGSLGVAAAPAQVHAWPPGAVRSREPRPLEQPAPAWPGGEATSAVVVVVRVEVDVDGTVLGVEPVSSAAEVFVNAAIDHVRALPFAPAVVGGEPVRRAVDLRVVFEPPPSPSVPASTAAPVEAPVASAPSEPSQPPPTEGAEPPDVRRVRVRTEEPRREAVTGGDFEIVPGKLALVPRGSAEKMLTLAPGVFLTNEGGEGHPSSFFLRGFDAGTGQDIEFTIEGVPLNEPSNAHTHGFTDTLFIIPETVRRLRVTEGPFDARQGDFAVAGSADFDIGVEQRGVRASGSYGRFQTGRALAIWAPEKGPAGTFVAVDYKQGDGFGVNRSHRAARAMAGFEIDLPRDFRLTTLATGYITRFDSAGVIRRDDFEARNVEGCRPTRDGQFFCTYDPNQGGALSRLFGLVRIARHRERHSFAQSVWATRRTMRIRENFTGYTLDVRTDGGPQRGDGLEQRYDVVTVGTRGSSTWRRPWNFRTQEIELGYGVRYDGGDTSSRRLRRVGGAPYATVFDAGLRIVDMSLWLAGTVRPLERLDINAGVRTDVFWFGVLDRNRPTMDRDGERLGEESFEAWGVSVAPRVSTAVELLRWPRPNGRWADSDRERRVEPGWGGLHWLSAYGIGTRSSDATALSDGEFAPFARVQSAETGLRLTWNGIASILGFEARAIAFYTHVDRDLLFDEAAGRNVPVGESNRFGALAVLRTTVEDWLDVQASYTWTEAFLPPPSAGPFEWTAGNRLPYVPRHVLRGDATLHHDFWIKQQPFDWSVSLGVSYVAPRPLPLDQFGTRYAVADFGARMRWRWIELGVEIQNMFDARYHQLELYYASSFASPTARPSMLPQLHFVAGSPLFALGTITIHFEPGERRRHRERVRLHELDKASRTRT
jgi:hypothetical protein